MTAEIQAGLARWADWCDNNDADTNLDDVDANVSFTYDFHYSVPTTYEPIQAADYNARCTWISDVLGNMGYHQRDCFERVYSYLEALRAAREPTGRLPYSSRIAAQTLMENSRIGILGMPITTVR